MTNFDAVIAIWGIIQPLLIQWVVGKEHGGIKWLVIIMVSVVSGMVLFAIQDGGITPDSSFIGLFWMIVKVLAYSLGSWGAMWKKIFPNKDNPLTSEYEGGGDIYTIEYAINDVWDTIEVHAKNGHHAMKQVLRILKPRLEAI